MDWWDLSGCGSRKQRPVCHVSCPGLVIWTVWLVVRLQHRNSWTVMPSCSQDLMRGTWTFVLVPQLPTYRMRYLSFKILKRWNGGSKWSWQSPPVKENTAEEMEMPRTTTESSNDIRYYPILILTLLFFFFCQLMYFTTTTTTLSWD